MNLKTVLSWGFLKSRGTLGFPKWDMSEILVRSMQSQPPVNLVVIVLNKKRNFDTLKMGFFLLGL